MKQVLEVARPWKNTFGSHSPEGERPSNASFRRSLGVRAGPTELPPRRRVETIPATWQVLCFGMQGWGGEEKGSAWSRAPAADNPREAAIEAALEPRARGRRQA